MCAICSQLGLSSKQSLDAHAASSPPTVFIDDPLVPNVTPIIGEGGSDDNGQVVDLGGIAAKFADNNDPTEASGPGLYTLLNLQQNPDGSYYFSGVRNVDAVLIGSKWSTLNLTYSFPTSGAEYPTGYDGDVAKALVELGPYQKAAALASFAQLSSYTNLTFTPAAPGQTAIIRIAQTGDSSKGSATGQFASDVYAAGDIFFGRTSQPYYDLSAKGTWGYATIMHEIGHTMGLKHGHQDYTFSDISSFFGTSPRYGTRAIETPVDGQAYSLMTYSLANGDSSSFGGDKVNQPQTYMQFDIAALQYLYGANFNTNSGATTYRWDAATGEMFVNNVGQGAPSGNKILMTLWDGDGVDTYDLSNYNGGVSVDLRPGAFSTFSQAQLANHYAAVNGAPPVLAPGNVANALQYNNDARSLIENAIGGNGADVITGNAANNVLSGGQGDDRLWGLGGNDRLEGGAGSDTAVFSDAASGVTVTLNDAGTDVTVGVGSETDTLNSIENIVGTAFADTMTGNSAANRLEGGAGGADTLTGGGGDDQLIGGGFSLVYDTTFSAPDISKPQTQANISIATAVATAGFFDVQSNPNIADATATPHATINAVAAGGGIEYYRVDVTAPGQRAVFDIDTGGSGTLTDSVINLYNSGGTLLTTNDTSLGDPGTTVNDDSAITYVFSAPGAYYIAVGRYISGTTANPLLAGQSYTLHISLSGSSAPQLANNTSSATLDGGAGNDLLVGTLGNDTISGGADNDTVSYVNAFSNDGVGVTVDLGIQSAAQNTQRAGTDTLSGIENLIGSAYNDTLTGDAGANVIEGGGGNDVIDAKGGVDTASYAGALSGVTVSLSLQGAAQATIGAGSDTLSGFENLTGSAFADTLTGDSTANVLTGGAGDDVLNGFAVSGVTDTLNGGDGSDTASFAGYTNPVSAQLLGAAAADAITGAILANFISIENLTGGSNGDFLGGDNSANVLSGGGGDDTLYGYDGDDRIEGGAGNDNIMGMGGSDTAVFSGTGTVTVDLAAGTATGSLTGTDTLSGIENLQGGSGVDTFTGDVANNIFYDAGGATTGTAATGGADTYNGAGGDDTVSYQLSTAAVSVNLALTTAQAASTGGDTFTSIENVIGTIFADVLLGGSGGNTLTGAAGADRLQGEGGNDIIYGGADNDLIFGDSNGAFTAGDGNDVLDGGDGFDTLVGGMGNDILRGGAGDDTLVGGIGSSYSLGGQSGTIGSLLTQAPTNDGGQDTFEGGDGSDIAYAYYTDQTGGVAFNLSNLAGDSAITVGGVAAGYFSSIERVIWRGGSGDDVVSGSGTLDTLIGNAGNDTISGWLGNDTIEGGVGNDTLDGGEGLDTLTFVNAVNGITVDLRVTTAQTTGVGSDTITNFEYVVGTAFSDTVRGTDDFNLLTDGGFTTTTPGASGGGNDSIYGLGGDDMILVNRNAAAAASTVLMDGGDGNDILEFRAGTLSAAPLVTGTSAGQSGGRGLSNATVLNLNTRGDRFSDTVTVAAGAGDDTVVLTSVLAATVDLGFGNDTLAINMQGTGAQSTYNITTGAGADIIQLNANTSAGATTDRTNVVNDFAVGDLGDKFELTNAYLNGTIFSGYATGSDPFATGYMRLLQSGTDMLLQVDRDGAGATNTWVTIFNLKNTYTGGFTAYNFDGFAPVLEITGTASGDTINGGAKADTLNGADGPDIISGNLGADIISGGFGADVLYGNQDNDVLYGNQDNDLLYGGQGNDLVYGGQGDDIVYGNAGDDVLYGNLGNDTLLGGVGMNMFDGGDGSDTVSYADAFVSVNVSLLLQGQMQNTGPTVDSLINIENLTGSAFNDTLTGDASANILTGGLGIDTLTGGLGADVLYGNQDDDVLYGNQDADLLYGGQGNDLIYGGQGDDIVFGNGGSDILYGNLGNDTFRYSVPGDSTPALFDTIMDFTSGQDRIDLRLIHMTGANDSYNFNTTGGVTTLTVDLGNNGTTDMKIVIIGTATAADLDWDFVP